LKLQGNHIRQSASGGPADGLMRDMTGVFTHFCGVRGYECLAAWCSRLRALWSFLSSSQATSSVESAKRFKPASRMAESYPGDTIYGMFARCESITPPYQLCRIAAHSSP
jgi:hypothetical protein